jgi:hypothetical protein
LTRYQQHGTSVRDVRPLLHPVDSVAFQGRCQGGAGRWNFWIGERNLPNMHGCGARSTKPFVLVMSRGSPRRFQMTGQ